MCSELLEEEDATFKVWLKQTVPCATSGRTWALVLMGFVRCSLVVKAGGDYRNLGQMR